MVAASLPLLHGGGVAVCCACLLRYSIPPPAQPPHSTILPPRAPTTVPSQVDTLLDSLPHLLDVAVLSAFIMVVFGVLGLQVTRVDGFRLEPPKMLLQS